eukprot:m.98921 g.98921  ORF g.98921 m.98921 type:complete len:150 (-) comp12447_c0_seq2:3609-4058(-)
MASADAMASLKRSPSQAVLELDKSAVPVQLKIGLAVSAKYRGAWCEGQIIRRTEGLTCKVQFNSDNSVAQVKSTDIRGDIQLNVCALQLPNSHSFRAIRLVALPFRKRWKPSMTRARHFERPWCSRLQMAASTRCGFLTATNGLFDATA